MRRERLLARRMPAQAALDRKGNLGDAVHLDFLCETAGLGSMTHKWSLLAEFGRQPLLTQWLALAGSEALAAGMRRGGWPAAA